MPTPAARCKDHPICRRIDEHHGPWRAQKPPPGSVMQYSKPVAPQKPDSSTGRTLRSSALTVAVPTTALPRGSRSEDRRPRRDRWRGRRDWRLRRSGDGEESFHDPRRVVHRGDGDHRLAFAALFAGSVTRTPKLSVPKKSAVICPIGEAAITGEGRFTVPFAGSLVFEGQCPPSGSVAARRRLRLRVLRTAEAQRAESQGRDWPLAGACRRRPTATTSDQRRLVAAATSRRQTRRSGFGMATTSTREARSRTTLIQCDDCGKGRETQPCEFARRVTSRVMARIGSVHATRRGPRVACCNPSVNSSRGAISIAIARLP